jgi:uncharacterized RDD family membrane protein YckC
MSDQQGGAGGYEPPGDGDGERTERRYSAERFAPVEPVPPEQYGAPAYGTPPSGSAPYPHSPYGTPAYPPSPYGAYPPSPYGAPAYGAPAYGPPYAGYAPPPLPQGVAHASWGRRALASVVDTLLLFVCVLPGFALYVFSGVVAASFATGADAEVLTVLERVLIFAGLGVWIFQVSWRQGVTGQSWGKRALGIHLVRQDRPVPPGGGTGLGRFASRTALGYVTCNVYSLVSVLWPLWDDRSQTLDDKIANTLVVRFPH